MSKVPLYDRVLVPRYTTSCAPRQSRRGGADAVGSRKAGVSPPEQGNSNSHGARPVHLIISMMKWVRIRKLSTHTFLSLHHLPVASGQTWLTGTGQTVFFRSQSSPFDCSPSRIRSTARLRAFFFHVSTVLNRITRKFYTPNREEVATCGHFREEVTMCGHFREDVATSARNWPHHRGAIR